MNLIQENLEKSINDINHSFNNFYLLKNNQQEQSPFKNVLKESEKPKSLE